MMEQTRQLELKRLLSIGLIFIAPVALILLFLVAGTTVPIILLIYITVVVEGIALTLWVLTTISVEENPALKSKGETGQARQYNFYFGRNRAETLALYVRSAKGRKEQYLRQHSRVEIAKVIERVLQEPPSILLGREQSKLSQQLDFVLHPDEGDAKNKGKDSAHLDYLSSLEDVIAAAEANQ
jgi:hypothetical protein